MEESLWKKLGKESLGIVKFISVLALAYFILDLFDVPGISGIVAIIKLILIGIAIFWGMPTIIQIIFHNLDKIRQKVIEIGKTIKKIKSMKREFDSLKKKVKKSKEIVDEIEKKYRRITKEIKKIEAIEKRLSSIEEELGINRGYGGIGYSLFSVFRGKPTIEARLKAIEEKIKEK